MPNPVSDRIFEFTCDLASASRLFTLAQVARHPDVSWRSQPLKRIVDILKPHRDYFEKSYGAKPTWRLSVKGRRALGVKWKPVNGMTQKSSHWIGLGDIWLALTFASGRPTRWTTEHYQVFDVFFIWHDDPYLLEYQRTPITAVKWRQKWQNRIAWYKSQNWNIRPKVVLVNTTGQQEETISMPKGTIHVRSIEQLPQILLKPPQL